MNDLSKPSQQQTPARAGSAKTLSAASCADDYDPNSMPVDKARALIRQFLTPISGALRLPVRNALSRVLADDVISPFNVPAHNNSAMDGYALRHADLRADADTTLSVAGTAFAGKPYSGTLAPGQAIRIMTGAKLPEALDTIVMQERVRADAGNIIVPPGQKRAQHVRYAGEDIKAGSAALKRGQLVRAAELGLIASLGIGEVSVYRPLRVAFFSTGDELRSVGAPLGDGDIYDSNRYTIYGMLKRMDFEVFDLGVVRDDPAAVERAFVQAASMADVIVSSGGVSVGDADFVKQMLNKLGEVLFWKIAMKPGRPLAYGKIGGAHFFGLPGNPVAVMVTFYQFVREALLTLSGQDPVPPLPALKAVCTSALKKAPGRTEFQRGILSCDSAGQWSVRATGEQGSGILSSMSAANCFIVLPTAQGNVEAGSAVDVQLLEGLV